MVERARELVPAATFLRGDVALVREVDFDSHTLFVATRND